MLITDRLILILVKFSSHHCHSDNDDSGCMCTIHIQAQNHWNDFLLGTPC